MRFLVDYMHATGHGEDCYRSNSALFALGEAHVRVMWPHAGILTRPRPRLCVRVRVRLRMRPRLWLTL